MMPEMEKEDEGRTRQREIVCWSRVGEKCEVRDQFGVDESQLRANGGGVGSSPSSSCTSSSSSRARFDASQS